MTWWVNRHFKLAWRQLGDAPNVEPNTTTHCTYAAGIARASNEHGHRHSKLSVRVRGWMAIQPFNANFAMAFSKTIIRRQLFEGYCFLRRTQLWKAIETARVAHVRKKARPSVSTSLSKLVDFICVYIYIYIYIYTYISMISLSLSPYLPRPFSPGKSTHSAARGVRELNGDK